MPSSIEARWLQLGPPPLEGMASALFHQGMLRSVRRGQNFTVIRSPRFSGAGFHHDAFTTGRRWHNFTVMRSPRVGSGRISQRCVLRVSTVAGYSLKAFPGTHPWQDFRLMYAKRGLGRKNTPSVAIYRRYVSKISWFWQDLRATYPKSPANRCLGIHIVKILPGRTPFPVRGLQIIHSANILPSCLPKPRKIASARTPAL